MPHSLDLSSTSGSEKCKLEFSALLADGTSRVNSELRVQYLLYGSSSLFYSHSQSHGNVIGLARQSRLQTASQ